MDRGHLSVRRPFGKPSSPPEIAPFDRASDQPAALQVPAASVSCIPKAGEPTATRLQLVSHSSHFFSFQMSGIDIRDALKVSRVLALPQVKVFCRVSWEPSPL